MSRSLGERDGWAGFLLGRLLRLILLLLGVTVLAFALAKLSPIDPIQAYLGPNILRVSPEQKAQIVARWGLDRPPVEQYLAWARQLLGGDLGVSMIYNAPVAEVIRTRLGASLALVGMGWLLGGLLGFALGAWAGSREGSVADRVICFLAYLLAATPTFWVAILLLLVFAVGLGWAPVCCAGPPGIALDALTWGDRLRHLILPVTVLIFPGLAVVALHTRAKMVEIMRSDVALYAMAQGADHLDIVIRHGLRHAALPALTIQLASLGELFGGSILAEQVYAYPGLGKATIDAGLRGDVPLLLAIALGMAVLVNLGNLAADILYRLVDPRLRLVAGDAA